MGLFHRSVRIMPFIIGTAGHIDHGKTTLIKALTGEDTDRLKEEKERGISIDLGFAHLDLRWKLRRESSMCPTRRFHRNMSPGSRHRPRSLYGRTPDDASCADRGT